MAKFLKSKFINNNKLLFDDIPIYDTIEYEKNFNNYKNDILTSKQLSQDAMKSFVSELFEKIKNFYMIIHKMKLNEFCGYFNYFENDLDDDNDHFKLIKNSVKYTFKLTKQEIYEIFKSYINTMDKDLLYNENTNNNLFDAVYRFLLEKYKI